MRLLAKLFVNPINIPLHPVYAPLSPFEEGIPGNDALPDKMSMSMSGVPRSSGVCSSTKQPAFYALRFPCFTLRLARTVSTANSPKINRIK